MYNPYQNFGNTGERKQVGSNKANMVPDNMNGTSPKLYNGVRNYNYQQNSTSPPIGGTTNIVATANVNSRMSTPMNPTSHIQLAPRNLVNYAQAQTSGNNFYDNAYGQIHPLQYQQYQQMLQHNYPPQQQNLYASQFQNQSQQPAQSNQQVHLNLFQPHYQPQPAFNIQHQQPQQPQPQHQIQYQAHGQVQHQQQAQQQFQAQREAHYQAQLQAQQNQNLHSHPNSYDHKQPQLQSNSSPYQLHQATNQQLNNLLSSNLHHQAQHHTPHVSHLNHSIHLVQQAQSQPSQSQSHPQYRPQSQPHSQSSTPNIYQVQSTYDIPHQQHSNLDLEHHSNSKDSNGNLGRKRGRKSKNQSVAATNPTFDQFGHSSNPTADRSNHHQAAAIIQVDHETDGNSSPIEKRKRGRPKTLLFDASINQYIDSSHPNYKSVKQQLKNNSNGNELDGSYLGKSITTSNNPGNSHATHHSTYLIPHEFNELEVQNLLRKKDRRGRPRKFGFEETGITVKGVKVGGIKKKRQPKTSDESVVKKARGRPRK